MTSALDKVWHQKLNDERHTNIKMKHSLDPKKRYQAANSSRTFIAPTTTNKPSKSVIRSKSPLVQTKIAPTPIKKAANKAEQLPQIDSRS